MASAALKKNRRQPPVAALLNIGNELLTGRTINTNAAFLGGELTRLGFSVTRSQVCSDDLSAIQDSLKQLAHIDLLILTGGLGPTPDDVTREAIAATFRVPLRFSEGQFQAMASIYRKLGREIPTLSRREAYYPANAKPLLNRFGIALGFWILNRKQMIVVLPGVPTELQKMFIHDVRPLLKKKFPNLSAEKKLIARMVGISEPSIMEKLGKDFFDQPFQFGIYPSEGETQICIRSESSRTLKIVKEKIQTRLKPWLYSFDDQSLAELIGNHLARKKKTLSVAESCTGGSLAFAWTRFAGASRYFLGSTTVYQASAKIKLGVSKQTLKKYGEVSAETASELAIQSCRHWKSDYGIGVTGIAGPSGGSTAKPIGLVFIAVSAGKTTSVSRHLFWGNREQVQRKAVSKSLELLWRNLTQTAL